MTSPRLIAVRIATTLTLLCASTPADIAAQATALQPDSALLLRAEQFTVGDYCRVARSVLASAPIMTRLETDSAIVRVSAATICDPLLSSFSLRALFGGTHAPLAAVARLHPQGTPESRSKMFDAMTEFRSTVQSPAMLDTVAKYLGPDTNLMLVRVSSTVQSLLTTAARDGALARLGRYERKLGPTSARLNGIEVFLNYAAQRWLPAFRANPLTGPSPLEVVASYTPGYITEVGGRAQPVSAAEVGLRRYLFGPAFGKTGWRGLLQPSYWAAGAVAASDRNGALVGPWENRTRAGAFVSWGSLKVAYVPNRDGAVLITRQFQAIPFVF
jgi:hypothetical protein